MYFSAHSWIPSGPKSIQASPRNWTNALHGPTTVRSYIYTSSHSHAHLSLNPTRLSRRAASAPRPPPPPPRPATSPTSFNFNHGEFPAETVVSSSKIQRVPMTRTRTNLCCAGGRRCGAWGRRRRSQEEDVPQVQLPWRRPRCAARHVHRRPRPALPRARQEKVPFVPRSVCFRGILVCGDLMWCVCFGRFQRGLKRKPMALIKKLRKAVSFQPLNCHHHFLLAWSDPHNCVDVLCYCMDLLCSHDYMMLILDYSRTFLHDCVFLFS